MIYILLAESIAICFFLCRLIEAVRLTITKTPPKPKKMQTIDLPSEVITLLENIDNYGTDKPQRDI